MSPLLHALSWIDAPTATEREPPSIEATKASSASMTTDSSVAAVNGYWPRTAVICIVYLTPGVSTDGSILRSRILFWSSNRVSGVTKAPLSVSDLMFCHRKLMGTAKPASHGGEVAVASIVVRTVPRTSSTAGDVIVTVGVGVDFRTTVTVVR